MSGPLPITQNSSPSQRCPKLSTTTSAHSPDGHVTVTVRRSLVTKIDVDAGWRANTFNESVENTLVAVVNAALGSHRKQMQAKLAHRAESATNGSQALRQLHDYLLATNHGTEMLTALEHMSDLLADLETEAHQNESTEPEESVPITMEDDQTHSRVHIADGQICHLSLNHTWSQEADDLEFAERVADLVNAGLTEYRAGEWEQTLAATSGPSRVTSALWEAHSYVLSAHLMDAMKLRPPHRTK